MNKQYVAYGIVGVLIGLFLGFTVANMSYTPGSSTQAARKGETESVNNGRDSQLPANHPDINSAEPKPDSAGPLPADHPPVTGDSSGAGAGSGAVATSAPSELPSLDPLPSSSKEKRTEQEYKNIQLLSGLPAERLMKVMFAFKDSLGVDCTFCHVKDQWEKDDKQNKQTARKMIKMTRDLNNIYVGGIGRVSCFTCHRGQQRPPA